MLTVRELSMLKDIIKEEINCLKGNESPKGKVYMDKLLRIQKNLKPYRINIIDNEIKKDIVELIGMRIGLMELELYDFEDESLISILDDIIEKRNNSSTGVFKVVSEIDEVDADDDVYEDIEVTENEARQVTLYLMKSEYTELMKKFVS